MAKISFVVKKALPHVKKLIGPAIIGMISGVTEAVTKQKAEMRLTDMESRITETEKLVETLVKKTDRA